MNLAIRQVRANDAMRKSFACTRCATEKIDCEETRPSCHNCIAGHHRVNGNFIACYNLTELPECEYRKTRYVPAPSSIHKPKEYLPAKVYMLVKAMDMPTGESPQLKVDTTLNTLPEVDNESDWTDSDGEDDDSSAGYQSTVANQAFDGRTPSQHSFCGMPVDTEPPQTNADGRLNNSHQASERSSASPHTVIDAVTAEWNSSFESFYNSLIQNREEVRTTYEVDSTTNSTPVTVNDEEWKGDEWTTMLRDVTAATTPEKAGDAITSDTFSLNGFTTQTSNPLSAKDFTAQMFAEMEIREGTTQDRNHTVLNPGEEHTRLPQNLSVAEYFNNFGVPPYQANCIYLDDHNMAPTTASPFQNSISGASTAKSSEQQLVTLHTLITTQYIYEITGRRNRMV
ncbi:hypothetical protein B0H16DRAFT_1472013 [Mycena metata]|uniref:Zn(2)-C6 fungal-type domain-containing protein n=1 Tax=Mycena metata TaxID=1033252 RepID=A0AAD7HP34_9AGAR|nr:hypothetical protein B0H16DRAFT_1472013 [Mycena metata]